MCLASLLELVRHAESDTMGQGSQDSLEFAHGGSDQEMNDGLDLSYHGERAYTL